MIVQELTNKHKLVSILKSIVPVRVEVVTWLLLDETLRLSPNSATNLSVKDSVDSTVIFSQQKYSISLICKIFFMFDRIIS